MIELNLKNIELEKEYKWKQLCEILEEPYKTGNTKVKQLKEFSSLCRFTKEGKKYIIHEIYDTPKEIEDKRKGRICSNRNPKYNILTEKERKNEFDGYYVYAHIMNDEYMYIGKGCKARAMNSMYQRFDKEDYEKIEIKILARFENEIDALEYEENKINYYQSIGQCKLNDYKCYHQGKTKGNTNKKILNKIDKLIEQKESMMKKIDSINNEIDKLYEQLTKK